MPKKKCKYLVIFIAFIFLINISGAKAAGFSDDNIINICGFDNVPARLPKITSTLYNLAKLLTPVVLIVMGMIDFTNAVMQGDEQKQKKSTKKFINRFIAAILIFLVMSIVQFVFRTVDSSNNKNFLNCMNCVLSNDNCGSSKSGKPTSSGSNSGSSSGNAAVSLITKTANKVASFALKALNKKGITTCDYCANEPTDSQISCINQCIKDNNIDVNGLTDSSSNSSNGGSSGNSEQEKIAKYATTFVGHPYVWGGLNLCEHWQTEPNCGVDCSGFVIKIYEKFGYDQNCLGGRTTTAQASNAKTYSSESDLTTGDLIYFYDSLGHVGIYIGNGEYVHASGAKTGVKISKLADSKPRRYESIVGVCTSSRSNNDTTTVNEVIR